MLKQKAQIKIYISPLLMVKDSLMQIKYIPTVAISTLIHCKILTLVLKASIPKIGTMTIYKEVINPPLPTVV